MQKRVYLTLFKQSSYRAFGDCEPFVNTTFKGLNTLPDGFQKFQLVIVEIRLPGDEGEAGVTDSRVVNSWVGSPSLQSMNIELVNAEIR